MSILPAAMRTQITCPPQHTNSIAYGCAAIWLILECITALPGDHRKVLQAALQSQEPKQHFDSVVSYDYYADDDGDLNIERSATTAMWADEYSDGSVAEFQRLGQNIPSIRIHSSLADFFSPPSPFRQKEYMYYIEEDDGTPDPLAILMFSDLADSATPPQRESYLTRCPLTALALPNLTEDEAILAMKNSTELGHALSLRFKSARFECETILWAIAAAKRRHPEREPADLTTAKSLIEVVDESLGQPFTLLSSLLTPNTDEDCQALSEQMRAAMKNHYATSNPTLAAAL
jgi:hypothetical protein